MEGAHDGEHQQSACSDVAGETDKECEETDGQHCLAVERVDHKSAEWPYKQRGYHIAREHKAYHTLVGVELLVEIQRKQGRQQVECEE